jgi:hypothetical protein
MPTIRKWEPEEIAALAAKKNGSGNGRKEVEAVYDQLIADMSVGDYATVVPDDTETKPTVRNRLKGAATRRGLAIVFQRTRDLTVVFHLEQIEE